MAEMVIPGTYIDVRSEGLISAGGITTGVVAVIGTAASGPVGVPIVLSGMSDASDLFGAPDRFSVPANGSDPLTLVRALHLVYGNGASTVVAVRVASPRAAAASFELKDDSRNTVATLVATTVGDWGNDIKVSVEVAKAPGRIGAERQTSNFSTLRHANVLPSPQNRLQVVNGASRQVKTFDIQYRLVVRAEKVVKQYDGSFKLGRPPMAESPDNAVWLLGEDGKPVKRYGSGSDAGMLRYDAPTVPPAVNEVGINTDTGALYFGDGLPTGGQTVFATYGVDHPPPESGEVLITAWNGDLEFHAGQAPGAGDTLIASYLVEPAACVQVTLTCGQRKETYIVPDGEALAALAAGSSLVTVQPDINNGTKRPAAGLTAYFGTGGTVSGNAGADAGPDEYAAGLALIGNRIVNLVVLAGQDAQAMGAVLMDHLKATEETDFERIGVIGATGTTVADFLGHSLADGRVVLVGPGIRQADGSTLPPAYTAAAVAGLIASMPVQASLTNKVINLPGIAHVANRGEQSQLIQRNVLTVVAKEGLRVLKGVTTEGVGSPYSAIPTRRIVDYAKYGVRSAANPYIGRLNNARVRAALKATLDAFLTAMVLDEALTGYTLEVDATRAQEIAGHVSVTMTIQPTFSIDFIRVVMTLQ